MALPMRCVIVTWEDAACRSHGPWTDIQEWSYEPRYVHQLGYVLYDGEEGMILTNAYIDGITTGPVDQIPRGMILHVVELNELR